jgi:hypothetical protein
MKPIFILIYPMHTCKTNRLTDWSKNKYGIDGILQPVIDGRN